MAEPNEAQALPPLEAPCDKCGGRGEYLMDLCPKCDGTSYAPTPFGERVLTLMRHNLRPMMRELARD